MKSKWESIKPDAIILRKEGNSIKCIEDRLGIPRSTLSGWFKEVLLTDQQRMTLKEHQNKSLIEARIGAVKWHNAGKANRLTKAFNEASETLSGIDFMDDATLELALAFLYLGEGAKTQSRTSLGSSDPVIAQFFVESIKRLYRVSPQKIKCRLHLRADQNPDQMKNYWSNLLKIPLVNFGKASFDQRTSGKPTYPDYHGVCQMDCGRVEIQRRLMYIASGFCEQIIKSKK
jgi:hypothetical protein